MKKTFDLDAWLKTHRGELNAFLEMRLPAVVAADDPGRLVEAMRYSLLAPGKRVRSLLTIAAAEAVGAPIADPVKLAAVAIEMVHCYSQIHADLAGKDDNARRRRATCHERFGTGTAILAGDALLTLSFEWLAEAGLLARMAPAEGRWARSSRAVSFINATRVLGRAAGMVGMVRGQAADLNGAKPTSMDELERLHREKTGALFKAALEIGGLAAGANGGQLTAFAAFGDAYGVAFQHADDLANGEHKSLASAAPARVTELTTQAVAALDGFGPSAEPLRALARVLRAR